MTEEELKQEAREWVQNNNYPYSNCPNIEKKIKQAYLAGAEPREKRIAELIQMLRKAMIRGRSMKAEEELKPIDTSKYKITETGQVLKMTKDEMKDRKGLNKQLAKAKELIEELSSSLSVVGECGEEECELLNRAEQFLNSEV